MLASLVAALCCAAQPGVVSAQSSSGTARSPATSRPATSRPATSRPATSRPATSQPTSRPAATSQPTNRPTTAPATFRVSGTVVDDKTGKGLVGVAVSAAQARAGVVTGRDGRYALVLPAGSHRITFSAADYVKRHETRVVRGNVALDVRLEATAVALDTVVVMGRKKNRRITNTDISVTRFTMEELGKVPVFMGEKDIMKTIQLTPGITTIAEGRSAYIVRGSGIDQNLILMDGMPLYYTSHMSGLFSVFNSAAVNDLVIYKGGMPARFGGRAASVLSVTMRGDDVRRFQAKVSVGLITSKASLAIPIFGNKLTVFVAGRSSYLSFGQMHDDIKDEGGLRTSSGAPGKSGGTPSQGFYFFGTDEHWFDLNGKLVWRINKSNTLTFSGFWSRDQGYLIGLTKWGNIAGSLRWQARITPNLTSTSSLFYSEYFTSNQSGIYSFSSGIKTGGFEQKLVWTPLKGMKVHMGGSLQYQDYNHGALEDTSERFGKFMPPMQSLENALFAGVNYKFSPRLSAYLGLRYSFFFRMGGGNQFVYDPVSNEPVSSKPYSAGEVMKAYQQFEPRFSVAYSFNRTNSVKFTYNRSAQYLRLMTNSMLLQWYDIWMPSTSNIPPMTTDQWAVGYFLNLFKHQYQFSVETYYKHMRDVADFEDGLHNYLVDNLEAYVATGRGRAYGLELMFKKPKGRLTGWISYNLQRSEQQIDVINKGAWYPSKFDKTHDFSAFVSFEPLSYFYPGHKLFISALFLYSTGNAVTLPEGYYRISGVPFPYWEGRNRYRVPAYHRLDLGLKYETKIWRSMTASLEMTFYNVYNRRNTNSIGYIQTTGGKGSAAPPPGASLFEPVGISYYGFRPSFLVTVKY